MAHEHPEEALDLAVAGQLPASQWGALDRHLATCAACRAHLILAERSRGPAPSHPWDGRANHLAIENALASLHKPRWFLPSRARAVWLSAAALVVLAGAASAAWRVEAARGATTGPAVPVVSPNSGTPEARPAPSSSSVAPIPPAATPIASDLPAPALQVQRAPELSAAALFAEATSLDAKGNSKGAMGLFSQLQRAYPGSRESRLSLMLNGRLLLDRGRAAAALNQFQGYLARGGQATEEALAGSAIALQRLGRPDAERSAWQRLLAAFPKSVYAGQATARLAQLNGGRAL